MRAPSRKTNEEAQRIISLSSAAQFPERSSGSHLVEAAAEAVARPVFPARPRDGVRRAEEAGLVFAFRARTAAILVVACAIVGFVPWPRDLLYLGFAAAFFLFGYVPFRLRNHLHAEAIKLTFVVLDVTLITGAVLNCLPSGMIWIDWPIQITPAEVTTSSCSYCCSEEAAVTYSPRRVLWTGGTTRGSCGRAAFFNALLFAPDTQGDTRDIVAQSFRPGPARGVI